MRIGIDCRLAGRKHAGIGRYIENLVTRLPKLSPETQWVYFFSDEAQAAEVLEKTTFPNVKIVLAPIRHYSFAEQTQLPRIFQRENLDLLHVPHFNLPLLYRGKVVMTIHDLLWHEHIGLEVTTLPAWQYHLKHFAYKLVVAFAMMKAKTIFVPAEVIKQTIARYYPGAAKKVVVTKEGVAEEFRRVGAAKEVTKTLVYVGSLYPHKNVRLVIDALPQLPDFELHIVGTRTVFQDDVMAYVKKAGLGKRVKFLGYVSDEKLAEMYKSAFSLIQPSFSEGFGLTGVEAMAAGAPVLASDIPVFQEIYQDAAIYFDPKSVESFCAAVQKLTETNRAELIKKAHGIANHYSWDSMSKLTFSSYLKIF